MLSHAQRFHCRRRVRDLAQLGQKVSLAERGRLAGFPDDEVPENGFFPGLISGVLSRAADAVVIRKYVVRFRRLELVRNGDRQKGQRE